MTFNRDEKERCPKTPRLTLTTITKPPTIKSKGKLKEVEEERREKVTELEGFDLNEHALVLSIGKRNNTRQGSASLDWMIEPNAETYEGKKPESSRQHRTIIQN